MKVQYLKEVILVILTCSMLFIGPIMQDPLPLSSSSTGNSTVDLGGCFQSFSDDFNYKLNCGRNKTSANGENVVDTLMGCLETSLRAMNPKNHPSCNSNSMIRITDPSKLLSLYKNITVIFDHDNSEFCRSVQDHLIQIGLGAGIKPVIPEGHKVVTFFGCNQFAHDVMLCCT